MFTSCALAAAADKVAGRLMPCYQPGQPGGLVWTPATPGGLGSSFHQEEQLPFLVSGARHRLAASGLHDLPDPAPDQALPGAPLPPRQVAPTEPLQPLLLDVPPPDFQCRCSAEFTPRGGALAELLLHHRVVVRVLGKLTAAGLVQASPRLAAAVAAAPADAPCVCWLLGGNRPPAAPVFRLWAQQATATNSWELRTLTGAARVRALRMVEDGFVAGWQAAAAEEAASRADGARLAAVVMHATCAQPALAAVSSRAEERAEAARRGVTLSLASDADLGVVEAPLASALTTWASPSDADEVFAKTGMPMAPRHLQGAAPSSLDALWAPAT